LFSEKGTANPNSIAMCLREKLKMKRVLLALLVLGIAPLFASAATITWTLEYVSSTDSSLNPIADQSSKLFGAGLHPEGYDPTTVNLFNVYFQASGLATDQDIAKVSADITLGAGLTAADRGGTFTFNTAETCGTLVRGKNPPYPWIHKTVPVFSSTGDAGIANDLLGLQGAIDADVQIDNHLGELNRQLLGKVYLTWNASHVADLQITGSVQGGAAWAVWTGNNIRTPLTTTTLDMGADSVVGQTMTFGLPEPMTMALLTLGGLAMLRRRRA
jgi:hypothetical protein